MAENRKPNRLIYQKSPYLLQHAYNPVDWYPWCNEAFEIATSKNTPIFLSIGYSTCHWCHVMERESFEDTEVAEVLNRHFVSIKVDREERPDIDHIYMSVCQALTGHGGWPLTLFLTPDRKPFYAGTYFPKDDRMGMPGLMSLLPKVANAWKQNKDELIKSSEKLIEAVNQPQSPYTEKLDKDLIHNAYNEFKYSFDSKYGGFGSAPKFPSPHNLLFLLRYRHLTGEEAALGMVKKTLDSMRKGGIYDHIGFGFSRYSTDRKWLVPHFEKMLYDNALLAMAYLETYQASREKEYAEIASQIFTYVLRDMTSPEGGFYSAEDADSEGVEGKFYIWTPDEVSHVLGERDGKWFCKYYDISENGNFEGYSIPNLVKSSTESTLPGNESDFVEKCRKALFEYREKRVHPYKDDKILASWNGLMIAAMAMGGRILENAAYTAAAEKAVGFVFSHMLRDDGRLLARYRNGEAAYPAYVDDYAFLIWGLIELYETTYKPEYLEKALKLSNDMLKYFWDEQNGGFFVYGSDSEQLLTRPKESYDGATPSGNSVAALNLIRLARITAKSELEETAHRIFKVFGSALENMPVAHSFLLSAFMYAVSHTKELVIVSEKAALNDAMLQTAKKEYNPFLTSVLYTKEHKELEKLIPSISSYRSVNHLTTAYLCENYTCSYPVTDMGSLTQLLEVKYP